MEICSGCGILAPRESTSCTSCKAVFPAPRLTVENRTDECFWVAVHCEARCGKCYVHTPLNHLDASGSATCSKCGNQEAFPIEDWTPVFEHAHAVGDLAGPDPNGREESTNEDVSEQNPFKSIGVDLSSASFGEQSGHIFVIASPGHPLCPQCHVPLDVPFAPAEPGATSCPSCKETAIYELPEGLDYDGLMTLVAEGNRIDRPPSADPTAKTWWLLFRGPSPKREAIERIIQYGPEPAPPPTPSPMEEVTNRAAREAAEGQKASVRVLLVVGALLFMIAGGVAYESFVRKPAHKPAEVSEPAEEAEKPAPKSDPKPGSGHATHGGSMH